MELDGVNIGGWGDVLNVDTGGVVLDDVDIDGVMRGEVVNVDTGGVVLDGVDIDGWSAK